MKVLVTGATGTTGLAVVTELVKRGAGVRVRLRPPDDVRGFLERGFVSTAEDVERVTRLLGHAPRGYQSFAGETATAWRA